MAYTTQAKVQSLFRDLTVDVDAVITPDEITEFIARADSIIDSALYTYYETPITGSSSLLIVEEISTLYVAHRVKTILELNEQISDLKQDVQGNLQMRADKLLSKCIPQWNKSAKRWDAPILPLIDAVPKAFSPDNGSLFQTHNTNVSPTTRTIRKGGNNW